GFVMSLYALYQSDEPLDEIGLRIDQALGGNLCRCTGYRAIKSAALQAMNRREASQLESVSSTPNSEHTVHPGVNKMQRTEKSQMATTARELGRLAAKKPDVQGFYQPRTVSELARIYLENPKMRLLGGGTDLALEVTEQCRKFDGIIHLGRVRELNLAKVNGESLELGAAVTLTRCLDILKHRIPGAENMLLRFGSDQIRNQATVGGNFGSASPIADLPPLLLALNCVLDLQKGDDIRQVPLDNFYTGYRKTELQPGEFIRTVRVSLPAPDSMFAVHKVSKRRLDDISTVCMAINLPQSDGKSQGVRLAFGGMAATPIRATRAEAALEDRVFDNQSVRDAKRALIEELHPISDMRASAGYRLQIAQNLLQRVLMEVTLS
nr:FAD binding domain-containing protein [Granulosicoccus sp.]